MELIKNLLREELTIFNERLKLTKETHILIENLDYVKYVLGITIPLNESQSFQTKQLILQEALNIQDLAKSIIQKVGNKVNTVVSGINDLNDLSRIIYLIITDKTGELANKTNLTLKSELKDALNRFSDKMNTIIINTNKVFNNIKELLDPIIKKILDLGNKLIQNYDGIKGILATLGLTTAIIWCENEFLNFAINNIVEKIRNGFINNISKVFSTFGDFFQEIFSNIQLNDIIGFFTNFNNVLGPVIQSSKIITIMANLLKPVVQKFKINKSPQTI